jgi:DNA-binding GntR family transcriptional regulator
MNMNQFRFCAAAMIDWMMKYYFFNLSRGGNDARENRQMEGRVRQVDVSTLQERVYRELRNALYQGHFVPGAPVTIRSLATALGTSPMPVREAMQRLVAERALVQTPNRTVRVAGLTAEAFDELTRIRMEIEGFAAQRAAQRSTRELCARLRAINESFGIAVANDDAMGMLERNQIFHFELYHAARATELLQIIESLWLRFGPILAFVRNIPGSNVMFKRGVDVHERVIVALEQGDSARARFCLSLDIRAAASWFRRNHHFDAPSRQD